MARSRKAAKAAGSSMEKTVVEYLQKTVDPDIERRVTNGAKDRGDVTGLRHLGQRVVIECKNVSRMELSVWLTEAEIARGNDDAGAGVVAHKRHGKGRPEDQLITMTLADFAALITGEPKETE